VGSFFWIYPSSCIALGAGSDKETSRRIHSENLADRLMVCHWKRRKEFVAAGAKGFCGGRAGKMERAANVRQTDGV